MLCLAGVRSCATSLQELRGWWVCQKKLAQATISLWDVRLFNTRLVDTDAIDQLIASNQLAKIALS